MKTQTRTQKSKPRPHSPMQPQPSVRSGKQQPVTRQSGIDTQLRQRMIAEAAYFIAAKRGFQGGSALQDWLQAEEQIDAKLLQ